MNKIEQALGLSEELGHTNGAVIVIDDPKFNTTEVFDGNQFEECLFEKTETPSNIIKHEVGNRWSRAIKRATLLTTMFSSVGIGPIFTKSDDNKTIGDGDSGNVIPSAELTVGDNPLTNIDVNYKLMGGVTLNKLIKDIIPSVGIVYAQQPVEEATYRMYLEIYKFIKDFEPTEQSYKQASQWSETGNEVFKDIPKKERDALIAGLKEAASTIDSFKRSEITSNIAQLDEDLVRSGLIKSGEMPYKTILEKTNNIVNIQEEMVKNYGDKEKRYSLMNKELTELKELTKHLTNLEPLIKLSEIEGVAPYVEEFSVREGISKTINVKVHKNSENIDIKIKRTKPELSFWQRLLGSGEKYEITTKFKVYDTSANFLGESVYRGINKLFLSTLPTSVAGQVERRYDVTIPVDIKAIDHGGDRWFFLKGPEEAEIKLIITFGHEKTTLSSTGKYLKSVKDVMMPLTKARITFIENELSEKKPIVTPTPTPAPTVKSTEKGERVIKIDGSPNDWNALGIKPVMKVKRFPGLRDDLNLKEVYLVKDKSNVAIRLDFYGKFREENYLVVELDVKLWSQSDPSSLRYDFSFKHPNVGRGFYFVKNDMTVSKQYLPFAYRENTIELKGHLIETHYKEIKAFRFYVLDSMTYTELTPQSIYDYIDSRLSRNELEYFKIREDLSFPVFYNREFFYNENSLDLFTNVDKID